jgi:hypothetical protein
MTQRACFVLAILVLTLVLPAGPAGGWSGSTHICTSNFVRDDVLKDGAIDVVELVRNPDGTVTRNLLGTIPVAPDLVEALRDCEHEFHAGSCSADAYPDMYIGQSIIHAFIPGQPWRATDWARHVLECAREYGKAGSIERKKAMAFAAGWLVHYAGDAFGHTHVNHYAGGAWDWGDMDIVLKHVAYESYINTKIPGAADETLRRLDMDSVFVRDALMLHEDIQSSYVTVGYMEALVRYHRYFADGFDKIEDYEDDLGAGIFGHSVVGVLSGLGVPKEFCRQQRDAASRALMEWGETSTRVIRYFTEGAPLSALSAVSQWVKDHGLHLLVGIPEGAEEVMDWLTAPLGWVMDPLKDLMEQTIVYLWEHMLRGTFERIVNPVKFMQEMHGDAIMAEVDALMGVTPGHPELDPLTFAPFHDTVVLGKLAMLDEAGLRQLSTVLGVSIPVSGSGDNILFDCMESLDASNQLFLYPKFRLVERKDLTEKAFRRLFLTPPYEVAASTIDPAHILFWPVSGVTIGVPVPDPEAPDCRLLAYVGEAGEGQGAMHRVPFAAAGIPSTGKAGAMTGAIFTRWDVLPEPGRYFFHLAVSRPVAGCADRAEDAGINLVLDLGGALPEGLAPPAGGGTGIDTPETRTLIEQQIANMERMLANPDLPVAARVQIEQALADLRDTLANLGTGDSRPPAAAAGDPFVFPEDFLSTIEEAWREMAAEGEGAEGSAPDDETLGRPAIGTVEDDAGNPVPFATVTMLEKPLFEQIRAATGVPWVRGQWFFESYLMSRTNAEGRYMILGVKQREYVVIASGPAQPKTEKALTVAYGATHGVMLPAIRLTGELMPQSANTTAGAAGTATAGADPAGFGQHHPAPDYTVQVATPILSDDRVNADGAVETKVILRPLAGFRGAVELGVLDLPEGLTAEFRPNPVTLDGPMEVTLLLRGPADGGGAGIARVTATSGPTVREARLAVSLAPGQVRCEMSEAVVRRGETGAVRVVFETVTGRGRGVVVRLGALPAGLSVRARGLRASADAPEYDLAALTLEALVERRDDLRARIGMAKPEGEEPPLAAPEALERAPRMIAERGAFLAPGGFLDVEIAAAADMAPGTWQVPVEWRRGTVTKTEIIEITVE